MSASEGIAAVLLLIGCGFFLAGTAGLLRFPDLHTRLHALAKADTVGLGFVTAGLVVLSGSWLVALKLVLIQALVVTAGATAASTIAGHAHPAAPGTDDG